MRAVSSEKRRSIWVMPPVASSIWPISSLLVLPTCTPRSPRETARMAPSALAIGLVMLRAINQPKVTDKAAINKVPISSTALVSLNELALALTMSPSALDCCAYSLSTEANSSLRISPDCLRENSIAAARSGSA